MTKVNPLSVIQKKIAKINTASPLQFITSEGDLAGKMTTATTNYGK
jgi:hypothetical protein